MSDLTRVERLWLGYRDAMPKDVGSVQLQECRRAFYAGVHALFTEMQIMLDPEAEPTENDVRKLELIQQELKRFKDKVVAGLA